MATDATKRAALMKVMRQVAKIVEASSLENNREIGLISSAATQVNKVLTTTQKDFANGTAL